MCNFSIAKCMDLAGYSDSDIIHKFKFASYLRPNRIEPIYYVVKKLIADEMYKSAYEFGIDFVDCKAPNDSIAVDVNIYKWELKYYMSWCAFKCGDHAKALELLYEIKNSVYGEIPSYARDMVDDGLRSVPSVQ